MTSKLDDFTRVDSIYTMRQKLILKTRQVVHLSEMIQVASALNITLDGLNFSNMRCPKIIFLYQSLNESSFEGGYYPASRFGKCLIERSNFNDSIISGSDMRKTVFSGSTFLDCNLRGCDMRYSFFIDCDFTKANLKDCDLRYSFFTNAVFDYADIRGANIEGVSFLTCSKNFIKITGKEKIDLFGLN